VCLSADSEASIMRRPWPTEGCCAMVKKSGIRLARPKRTLNIQ